MSLFVLHPVTQSFNIFSLSDKSLFESLYQFRTLTLIKILKNRSSLELTLSFSPFLLTFFCLSFAIFFLLFPFCISLSLCQSNFISQKLICSYVKFFPLQTDNGTLPYSSSFSVVSISSLKELLEALPKKLQRHLIVINF